MKEYKIVIRLDNIETPVISIEAENWQDVVNHILGDIEIVDIEEEQKEGIKMIRELKIDKFDYQRNGISGEGFNYFQISFKDDSGKKVEAIASLTVEDDNPKRFNGSCRIIVPNDFYSHWRGDCFEEEIRELFNKWFLKENKKEGRE